MSGGHWNYENDDAARELFGWGIYYTYGEDGFKEAPKAREINPMGNRDISELVWDIFCLIHSRDWYLSGDNGKEKYDKDVQYFLNKWTNRTQEDKLEAYKQDLLNYANQLAADFSGETIEDD